MLVRLAWTQQIQVEEEQGLQNRNQTMLVALQNSNHLPIGSALGLYATWTVAGVVLRTALPLCFSMDEVDSAREACLDLTS